MTVLVGGIAISVYKMACSAFFHAGKKSCREGISSRGRGFCLTSREVGASRKKSAIYKKIFVFKSKQIPSASAIGVIAPKSGLGIDEAKGGGVKLR